MLPTSILLATSIPLLVVPILIKYPVASATAFQEIFVSIRTSISLLIGLIILVHNGGRGIVCVVKLSVEQLLASPSSLYGVIVTSINVSSGKSVVKS